MVYLWLFIGLVLNAVANILMKLGAADGGLMVVLTDPRKFIGNAHLLFGIVAFVLALGFYTFALSKIQLSIAYPIMTSMGFLIVVGFSVLSLGESVVWWQYVGMVMIVLGVVLVSQVP